MRYSRKETNKIMHVQSVAVDGIKSLVFIPVYDKFYSLVDLQVYYPWN